MKTNIKIRSNRSSGIHTHIKFKPGTVEKNSSTIGPPAGIEPTPL